MGPARPEAPSAARRRDLPLDARRRNSSPGPKRHAEFSGREAARKALLSEDSLESKLAAVAEGDPLGLYALARQRVRERFLYLAPDRVLEESVFNVVAMSPGLRKEEDFGAWLEERVDEAIESLMRRDCQAMVEGAISMDLVRESEEYLTKCWKLPAQEAFEAAVRFNNLPDGLGPLGELHESVGRAMEAILGYQPGSLHEMRMAFDREERDDE